MEIAVNQVGYELESGVMLVITPLTAVIQRTLRQAAAVAYPYPDPAPYIKPIVDSFEPGAMTRAEDSPEYLELRRGVDAMRLTYFWNLVIDACVDYADGPREKLIEQNARLIQTIRANIRGTETENVLLNDWVTLIISCLATGESEVQEIVDIALGATPLTQAEIVDGFRMFRRMDLSNNGLPNANGGESAPVTKGRNMDRKAARNDRDSGRSKDGV